MPSPQQLYQSNPLTLTGSEYMFLQQANGSYGGATAAQVANCVDPVWYRRTWMPRAGANNTGADVSNNATALTLTNVTTTNVNVKQDAYAFVFPGAASVKAASPGQATISYGDFTCEMWVTCTNLGTSPQAFSSQSVSTNLTGFSLNLNSTGMNYYTGGGAQITGTVPIVSGALTHIAVVRQGGLITMYTNGVNSGSSTNSGITTAQLTDGQAWLGNWYAGTNSLIGTISGFRYSQFAQYSANFTPPTTPFPVII